MVIDYEKRMVTNRKLMRFRSKGLWLARKYRCKVRHISGNIFSIGDQTANEFQRKLVSGGRGAARSNGADKKVGDSNVPVVDRYFRSSLP